MFLPKFSHNNHSERFSQATTHISVLKEYTACYYLPQYGPFMSPLRNLQFFTKMKLCSVFLKNDSRHLADSTETLSTNTRSQIKGSNTIISRAFLTEFTVAAQRQQTAINLGRNEDILSEVDLHRFLGCTWNLALNNSVVYKFVRKDWKCLFCGAMLQWSSLLIQMAERKLKIPRTQT